jgi:vancomycin resistance protein YoaR
MAGMTRLGRWKTKFTPSNLNGDGANIRTPARRIDGTIVNPGETFNFIQEVLPITEPPYHLGGLLKNGQIIEDGALGGGMCSASTTLFNAAMRAGLNITERRAHALYISRYPVGLDATVYGTATRGQNVTFINDMDTPIYIRGIPRRGAVIFEIWGTDDGRTVKLSKPKVKERREAVMYYEYTNDLEPGELEEVYGNYDAFHSSVTRTVRDANGNVIHENVWNSQYKKLNGLTMVGRYKGDPKAGTLILASEYPGPPDPKDPEPPDPEDDPPD